MEHMHRLFITAAAAAILCACVTLALPAARAEDSLVEGDYSQLANLISRLKAQLGDNYRNGAWALVSKEGEDDSSQSPEPVSADKLVALRRGFLGFNKRQGGWSFDYGLGGGRFGKRYYGDYGIGGGRFGRDVDHVDVADTNDATM
ncbi:uncharacterized protein LOC143291171 [Babylonia areolata]|uniref:uncharacterized protein LOC143291171 n=1 Tax=Babylonia areolata TaxID=304850 RepID=UPI003FCF8066